MKNTYLADLTVTAKPNSCARLETAKKRDFISIRGKSGVGKTTLLKIVGLLEPPSQGEVKLLGKNVDKLRDNEKSNIRLNHIGFIFQFFNLLPSLTVHENIELPLALAGATKNKRREKAENLLEYFDLACMQLR